MPSDDRYARARERVRELRTFYTHLFVYIAVNSGLVFINLAADGSQIWAIWPILGWGIGLVVHGFNVLGIGRLFGPTWEERNIERLVREDERRDAEVRRGR